MQIKPFLYTGVAVVALAGLVVLPGVADAQKGAMLSPVTKWAVNKVDAQGESYCTLAQRFRKDTVLTISRNVDEESSLALDFQRPVMRVTGSLDVVLDPGAGQQRKFSVKPASNQALVVRLGRDEAFFSALEKTGFLRAEIDGSSYMFNLSSIDEGQNKLETCLKQAEQVRQAMAVPPPVVEKMSVNTLGAENNLESSFKAEIAGLQSQIATLHRENEQLKSDIRSGEDLLAQAQAAAKVQEAQAPAQVVPVAGQPEAQADRQNAQAEIKQLTGKLLGLTSENNALRSQLNDALARADTVNAQDVAALQAAQQENQKLQAQLQEQIQRTNQEKSAQGQTEEQVVQKIAALKDENTSLKSEISTLKQNLSAQANLIAQAGQKAGAPEQEMIEMRRQIARLQDEKTRQEKEIADLTAEHMKSLDMSDRQDSLQTQLSQLRTENDVKTQKIAELAAKLEQGYAAQMKLKAENSAAQNALDDASDNVNESALAYETLQKEKADLTQENETLKQQVAALGERVETLPGMDGRIKDLENEKIVLQEQLAIAQKDKKDEEETLRIQQAMQDSLAVLSSENTELKEKLAQYASIADDTEKLSVSMQAQEKELIALKEENAALAQQLTAARQEVETATKQLAQAELREKEARESEYETLQNAEDLLSQKPQQEATNEPLSEIEPLVEEAAVEEAQIEKPEEVVSWNAERTLAQSPETEQDIPEAPDLQEALAFAPTDPLPIDQQPIDMAEAQKLEDIQTASGESHQPQQIIPDESLSQAQKFEQELRQSEMQAGQSAAASPEAVEIVRFNEERATEDDIPLAETIPEVQALMARSEAEGATSPSEPETLETVNWNEQPREKIEQVTTSVSATLPPSQPEEIQTAQETQAVVEQSREPAMKAVEIYQPVHPLPAILAMTGQATPNVQMIKEVSSEEKRVYQWKEQGIFGTAEQSPIYDPANFDERAQLYLEQIQSRCHGDFAVVPESTDGEGGLRVDSYDIACVGSRENSSAALTFVMMDNTFTMITHEAPTDGLEQAIEERNKIVTALRPQGKRS